LVVSVDVLILKLGNLIQQHAQLVGNVGNIFIAGLTPDGQLLLPKSVSLFRLSGSSSTYSYFHSLTGNGLQAAHHVLLHLNKLGELLS
jgi:hypothetical protein